MGIGDWGLGIGDWGLGCEILCRGCDRYDLLCTGIVLVVELVLHVVQELADDGLRARVDVELICIRIEITREDVVTVRIDLDRRDEVVIDEQVR